MAEYASRHCGTKPLDEFAADELAFELHLTPLSAGEQMHYATTVAPELTALADSVAAEDGRSPGLAAHLADSAITGSVYPDTDSVATAKFLAMAAGIEVMLT
jgi:hypothetical protein